MHRALQIPSLLSEILHNVATMQDSLDDSQGGDILSSHCRSSTNTFPKSLRYQAVRLDRHSCLCAALTCKTFLGPALDVIWRDMTELKPIIMLISGLEIIPSPDPVDPDDSDDLDDGYLWPYLYADRALSSSDLELARIYGRRVRTFNFYLEDTGHSMFPWLHHTLATQLALMLTKDGEGLFPHLRSIVITGSHPVHDEDPFWPYISLFLSPMLQSTSFLLPYIHPIITTASESRASSFWPIMQQLTAVCGQSLKSLNVEPPSSQSLPASVIRSISEFATLEHLIISIGDYSSLKCLVNLPRLVFLSLNVRGLEGTLIPMPHERLTFSHLISLELRSASKTISLFFSLFHLPVIDELSLGTRADIVSDHGPQEWERIALVAANNLPGLRTFILQGDYLFDGPLCFSWHTFSPLLRLRNVVDLRICSPWVRELTKQDFMQIATTWPNLEYLDIGCEKVLASSVDHTVFLTVASSLRSLRVLKLCINMRNASKDTLPIPAVLVPQTALRFISIFQHKNRPYRCDTSAVNVPVLTFGSRTIDVCTGAIERVTHFATFLDTLFPQLETFWVNEGSADDGIYGQTQNVLKQLQKARKRGEEARFRVGKPR